MIRVLVVDDSPTVREFLLLILNSDPQIEVVGTAGTGEEALQAVDRTRPDVITMDVQMPKMNGIEATRRIMETRATPVVIVSGLIDVSESASVFRAMEAGALAVLPRPPGVDHPQHKQSAAELIQTVKLMSEVKVVRRWSHSRPRETLPGATLCSEAQPLAQTEIKLVAMGASTGGPPILRTILSRLAKDFPVPVLIVQHMAAGFTQGLAEWLAQSSSLPVHLPTNGQFVLPGCVYVAPDGFHMTVGMDGRVWLNTDDPENGLRPSVSQLFRSVTKAYGPNAIGVLLSGMGRDGAPELKLMRDRGAVTIAQDRDSSVIHGMPGEAIRLDGATYVLPPEKIPTILANLLARTAIEH